MKKRKFKFAPLTGGYMATSMLGILISLMYVYPKSANWGVTFTLIFIIMFVASIVSMTTADPEEFIELEEESRKKKKKN